MIKGIAADLHFHQWSAFAQATTPTHPLQTGNSRLDGLLDELTRLARETRDAGGRWVVLAGDVFHVRGSVSPTVMNSVKMRLEACVEEFGVMFIILAGNHDLEGKNSTVLGSAVTALAGESIRVVNEPTVIEDMVLVPWFESVEALKATIIDQAERLTDADRSHMDLILHAPIDGVIEGLPMHGLTADWLASLGFRRVFSGHYHNHKEFPSTDGIAGSVYSIGALAHHSWSDVGSRAGFLIVDDERVRWMKSHLPAFVDVDKLDVTDAVELGAVLDGNFARLKIEASKAAAVEQAREELLALGARAVLIMAVPEPPARDEAVRATVHAGASVEASIGEFVKTIPGVEDSAAVLREALSVLSAADAVEAA